MYSLTALCDETNLIDSRLLKPADSIRRIHSEFRHGHQKICLRTIKTRESFSLLGNGQAFSLVHHHRCMFISMQYIISSLKPSNLQSQQIVLDSMVNLVFVQNVRHVSNCVLFWLYGIIFFWPWHHVWHIRFHWRSSIRPKNLYNKD